ncbi:MAG: PQQ-like beta-propeller repeat protein, partial [Anaerolineales bacterium]|nr:PQQ-like beta-propeller repeat protein [Anaerolineales bacterium]
SMDHNVYALNSSDGTVLWQSQMNGAVPSAPTYVDGTLYVGTFGGVLHALDASSGEELWAYEADDWIWSTPSVVDDMILFADGSGNVYAISTSGGEELWRQQAKGAVQAAILVHDGVAYVGAVGLEDEAVGQILALDLSDGSIIWEKPTLAPIYADMVIAADALVVAESSEEALLVVYDLENGAEIWKYLPE